MTFPNFRNVNFGDDDLNKLEQNIKEVFSYLQAKQFIDGILLEGLELSAGSANLVPHLLSRKPKGYVVVKKRPSVDSSSAITDVGTEKLWPFATAPYGWMIENGAAISRTTYADLFRLIGTTYGVGDGSTTFNIPDNRGRSPA